MDVKGHHAIVHYGELAHYAVHVGSANASVLPGTQEISQGPRRWWAYWLRHGERGGRYGSRRSVNTSALQGTYFCVERVDADRWKVPTRTCLYRPSGNLLFRSPYWVCTFRQTPRCGAGTICQVRGHRFRGHAIPTEFLVMYLLT